MRADLTDGSPNGAADTGRQEIDRLLALAHTRLGMEVAWVSRFTDTEQVIVAASGDTAGMNVVVGAATDLPGSYCARVLTGALPAVISDARRHLITRELPVTRQLAIGSYVGVPWHAADGTPAGMICCVSRHPHPGLDERAPDLLGFIADVLTPHLTDALLNRQESSRQATALVNTVLSTRAIQPVFQPVVRLGDGTAVAFEALARFPAQTFTGPDRAFAAAAYCGLGTDLEHLAIQRALEHLPEIPDGAWLGVNLSADALLDPGVQATVLAYADRRIGVELTEHTPVQDYPALLAVTERLRAAGIQIVIDDAGAGFASFHHILQLRPDTIKLDIALVRNIDTDRARQALARSLVSFAADIGAALIAEGIETAAEHQTLRRLGVGYGQGFYLAKPAKLPASSSHHTAEATAGTQSQ